MPVLKCDYFVNPYIYNKKLVALYSPIVSIQVSANRIIYPNEVDCFLDSGSDFNLMPADIAEKMKINVKKGERITHMGIGNVGIIAYSHPVNLHLERYKIRTNVHFSSDHKIPLLGRHGFFKYFKRVIFNEKGLQLELEY